MIGYPEPCCVSRSGRLLLALAVLAALPAAPAARGEQPSKAAASLEIVPDDALFYTAMLRNREQLEAVLRSKAWAKLSKLPLVQMGLRQLEKAWEEPTGPQAMAQAMARAWLGQEENRRLIRLLGDMVSDEIFCYSGRDTAALLALLGELQTANQFAPLIALAQGRNPRDIQSPEVRARVLLQALAQHPGLIKAPDLVLGFKLRDGAEARAQLKRLDRLVKGFVQQNPQLEGHWAKVKVGGGDFYTLKLDGRLVPWDRLPWAALEENPGEFDKLKDRLRDLKMTLSVGLRGSFLIVAVGESAGRLKRLGTGKRLADRDEFKPLARFANRPLTSITYASKQWQALEVGGKHDLGEMFHEFLGQVRQADLTPEQKERIEKDLRALGRDLAKYTPRPGASLSFAFLSERGSDSYSFDWTEAPDRATPGPLNVLKHVGGAPLLFAAHRTVYNPEEYRLLVKWVKVGWGYLEEFGIPRLPEPAREKYEEFMKGARPLLARLDRALGRMLLPGLGSGESAFVLDARLTSKHWHQAMPPAEATLPLPGPALVCSVKDATLVRKGANECREVLNGLIGLTGLTDFKLPPPDAKEGKAGTLYFYPLPEQAGLDRQISPTAGLSERWLVLAISQAQARRLLQPTPLRAKGKLLADSQRLLGAVYLNWEGMVGAAAPWVEYALQQARAEGKGEDLAPQIHTMMEVLKVLRNYTSMTYTEGGAVVTHGETVIRDVD
jgi:hypothetical protein